MADKNSPSGNKLKGYLTEEQYLETIVSMNISEQSKDIAHGVLVEGRNLNHYSKKYKISNTAVHQLCKRIKSKFISNNSAVNLPKDLNVVIAIIPETQMPQFEQNQQEICKFFNVNREVVIARFNCEISFRKSPPKNFSR